MKSWDYAELSKIAKANGRPEKYVEMIKNGANKTGLEKGLLLGVSIGVVTGGKKLKDYISKRKIRTRGFRE